MAQRRECQHEAYLKCVVHINNCGAHARKRGQGGRVLQIFSLAPVLVLLFSAKKDGDEPEVVPQPVDVLLPELWGFRDANEKGRVVGHDLEDFTPGWDGDWSRKSV